jgi:hypothetical protein
MFLACGRMERSLTMERPVIVFAPSLTVIVGLTKLRFCILVTDALFGKLAGRASHAVVMALKRTRSH